MSTKWYLSDEQARCTGVPTATASTTTDEGHIPGRNTCRAMGREKAGAAVDINFHSLEAPHPGSPESFDFCRMWIGPKLAPQTLATGTQLTLAAGFNAGGGSVNFWLWGFVYLQRGGARVATLYGDTTDTEGVQGGAEVDPETPCVWRELAFPALTAPVTVQEGDRIVVEAWAREYDETGGCIGHGLHLVYAGTDDDYDDGDLLVDGDAAAYLEANNTIEESTEMPTITDWYPLIVEPSTTEVTIKGTGFKAAQGDGTVTVGGKALTSVTWGDTSIVGKIAADCPYGANDVVVTNSDGVAVTVVDAFQCIDPTVRKDTAEVLLGQMGSLYINGVDVGYCEDEVGYKPGGTVLDFRPNDRNTIAKSWRINTGGRGRRQTRWAVTPITTWTWPRATCTARRIRPGAGTGSRGIAAWSSRGGRGRRSLESWRACTPCPRLPTRGATRSTRRTTTGWRPRRSGWGRATGTSWRW